MKTHELPHLHQKVPNSTSGYTKVLVKMPELMCTQPSPLNKCLVDTSYTLGCGISSPYEKQTSSRIMFLRAFPIFKLIGSEGYNHALIWIPMSHATIGLVSMLNEG